MKQPKCRIGAAILLATLTLVSFRPASAVFTQHHRKSSGSSKRSSWQVHLQRNIQELEKLHPNQIGLYVKDLSTGEEFSLHAEESWYLASTVKIPVAMEVLRQVDAKKLKLNDELELTPNDYVDGNGPLNFKPPGSRVTIGYLIEQMIIWSDNTATDMLLRTVGLEQVNKLIQRLSPGNSFTITTLKDVRRKVYSELHSKALELSGQNFMELKKIKDPRERIEKLASLIKIDHKDFKLADIDAAYEAYYSKGFNSASPKNYSKILEAIWDGDILSPGSRQFLIQTMIKTRTGKNRIRSGLKKPWIFAHKTGTQHQRICDVGYVLNPSDPQRKPLIVVSFVRNVPERKVSEKIMKKIARTIAESGVL